MKHCFYIICFLLAFFNSQAQYVRCGTDVLHKMRMEKDPQYRAFYENVTRQMEQLSAAGTNQRTTSSIITIPVVVHVLWNTSGQNISDAQVRSQMDVLNEDFAAMNNDLNQ